MHVTGCVPTATVLYTAMHVTGCVYPCSDLLSPADEVAEEVSDAVEAEDKGNLHLSPAQVRRVTG